MLLNLLLGFVLHRLRNPCNARHHVLISFDMQNFRFHVQFSIYSFIFACMERVPILVLSIRILDVDTKIVSCHDAW